MILIFFQALARILFEPVIVCAALAAVSLAIRRFPHRNERYWGIGGALLFMIGLRLGAQRLMVSSRYYEILIFPAVILTAMLFFREIPLYGRIFLRKRQAKNAGKKLRVFSGAAFLILCVCCIGKTLHVNPFAEALIRACRCCIEDARGKEIVCFYNMEAQDGKRLRYYLRELPHVDFQSFPGNDAGRKRCDLINCLQKRRNYDVAHYILVSLPPGKNFNIPESAGKCELIFSSYTSRKKKRKLFLFRFIPNLENLHKQTLPVPERTAHQPVNGDFETRMPEKKQTVTKRRLAARGATEYQCADILLPDFCWINVKETTGDAYPMVYLDGKNPIAGKYSIIADSRGSDNPASFNMQPVPMTSGKTLCCSGYVRAEGNRISDFRIEAVYTLKNAKRYHAFQTLASLLQPGLYRFSFPIPPDDDYSTVHLIFRVNGRIAIDNVEIKDCGNITAR